MYQYPYGDTQQLNLDWILTKIKELEAGGSEGGSSIEDVANTLISATYNAATQYRRYDYCFYNGKLYRCLSDTTGAFTPADWQEALIGDDIPILTRLINAVDTSLTSLQNTVNDLDSDDIDNASTVTGTSVSDALETLDSAITNLDSDDVDNASTVTGTSVSDALETLDSAIGTVAGDVSTVQTTLATLANAHFATLADESYTGQLRAQKYLHTIVISGNVNVGSTGISGQLAVIATLANQELPDPGTSSTVWGYGTYNGNVGFIQFELQANGNLRSRHGSGTITGNIQFPNATTFG